MKRYTKSTPINAMAKELSQGIFWVLDDKGKVLAYPFGTVDTVSGIAKSGTTYNHKNLWNDIKPAGSKLPYNYYPRGRVALDNKNRPVIYINPSIDGSWLPLIKEEFGIKPSDNCTVRYDYSDHYKCHLDEGYKPSK